MTVKKSLKEPSRALLIFLRILTTLCLIGTVVFIFSNSAEIGTISTSKSAPITERFNQLLQKLGFGITISEYLIRKLAHLAEYALLGFWLILTLRVYTRRIVSFAAWPLFAGLLVAVLDEFYQTTIPGRDGQVRDVVLDFGGVVAGVFCGLVMLLFIHVAWLTFWDKRKRKNGDPE